MFLYFHLGNFLQLLLLVVNQLSEAHFELLVLLFVSLFELSVPLVICELLLFILSSLGAHLLVMHLLEEVKLFSALTLDLHRLFFKCVLLLTVELFLLC